MPCKRPRTDPRESGIDDHSSSEEHIYQVIFMKNVPRLGITFLRDMGTFEIHRSRFPTHVFKSVVTDMDIMLMQYGPPYHQNSIDARSMFISPVFNHLIKLFDLTLKNYPNTIRKQDRIEYAFQCFGAVVLLVVEMPLTVGNDMERLNALSHIMAECDRHDLKNDSNKYRVPIHCIFIRSGGTFEFFKYERNPNTSLVRGAFSGDPKHLSRGLNLPNFTTMESSFPFIRELRSICEVIFDMLLIAYITGLKKYQEHEGVDTERVLQPAERALAAFREAQGQCKAGEVGLADETVDRALISLKESTEAVPKFSWSRCIMKDWDDTKV